GKDALGRSDTPRRPPRPSQALGRTSRGPESSIRPGFTPQPARTRRRARAPSPKNATAATPLSVPYPYYTGTSSIWKQEKRKTQMAFIGYARVSAVDQDYDGQIERLEQAGCGRIYAEKMSGKSQNGRHELHKALRGLDTGDTLVVVRLDRLARSVRDLFSILLDAPDTTPRPKAGNARIAVCVRSMQGPRPRNHCCL